LKAFVLLTTLFIGFQLHARVIEVCPDCDVNTVRKAIEISNPHDTLLIQSGTYKEHKLEITHPLTLIGIDFPILDPGNGEEIMVVNADSVIVKGIQFQNIEYSYTVDRAAIKFNKSHGSIIEGNRLYNTFFGIYLAYCRDVIVKNNTIIGNAEIEFKSANAIHIWYSKRITVENNEVAKHRDGIYLEFVDNSVFRNNFSHDNIRYGMHFMFSNHDEYYNNTFKNNGVGVAVMFSEFIKMFDNEFLDNWGPISYGILLKDIRDSDMQRNIFRRNTIAIYGEGSNRINIYNNDFVNNGWALKIMGNCEDIVVNECNFIGNSFEVATNSRYNSNEFDNNYWSGYVGYDLNRDGIGDVPYRPVKLFSYLVQNIPEAIILLRSPFIGLLNHTEKVVPTFTPETLVDNLPKMRIIKWSK
jgi:nitrous oxidase accessory protein